LTKAEDAIEIDTTDLTIDEQVSKIIEIVNKQKKQ
jgi:cytidylate kinase